MNCLFLNNLVDLASRAIWVWYFISGKIFDYYLNFSNGYRMIHIFHFLKPILVNFYSLWIFPLHLNLIFISIYRFWEMLNFPCILYNMAITHFICIHYQIWFGNNLFRILCLCSWMSCYIIFISLPILVILWYQYYDFWNSLKVHFSILCKRL